MNNMLYGFVVSEVNPIDVNYYASLLNCHVYEKTFTIEFERNIVHNMSFIGENSSLIRNDLEG